MLNVKTLLSIGGTLLGAAGTIVSGVAANKAMKEEVAKKVAEEVSKVLSK